MPNANDSLPPSGPKLLRAFESLVSILNERKIRYAIIGGLAMLQHARVRTTDDIDALITLPQISMPGLDMKYVRTELDTLMPSDDPRVAKLESWVRRATTT